MEMGNRADVDNRARLGVMGLLRKRRDLSTAAFDHDWEHIHGRLASRLGATAFFQMRQHHLGEPVNDLLPVIDRVNFQVLPAMRLDGVSEGTFRRPEDLTAFVANPDADVLMADEQNLLSHSVLHMIGDGELRTLLDKRDESSAAPTRQARYLVFLRPRLAAHQDRFARLLEFDLPERLATEAGMLRLRTYRLQPYGNDYPAASIKVDHEMAPADQYGGALELMFTDQDTARAAFAKAYGDVGPNGFETVAAVHAYPVRYVATLNAGGSPTDPNMMGQTVQEIARTLRD